MIEVSHEQVSVNDLRAPGFADLLGYWRTLKGERLAPSWDEIELIDLPAKILPYLTVIEVEGEGATFIYTFCGTGHMKTKTRDYTAQSVAGMRPRQVADDMLRQLRMTVQTAAPVGFVRTFKGPEEARRWRQTILRLPLSRDGVGVHGVLSLSDWSDSADLRDFYLMYGRDAASAADAATSLRVPAS